MKRTALNMLLLLAAGLFIFSGCARRGTPANTETGTASTATTTASPSTTGTTSIATTTTSPSTTGQPQGQASSQAASSTAARKNGWWIRINPGATTAEVIAFQIGTSKVQREEWRVWRAGEPAEFDVPEKYIQVPRLYVRGNLSPIGRLATLCMMYKTRGVEHMRFDDDDAETKSQVEIDIKCR